MDRKAFVKGSVLTAGSIFLAGANGVYAQHIEGNGIDRLTDANGKFVQLPLPYSATFLEPYMDAETLQLHHKFHHGGAVTAANKDLSMIRKAVDENSMETVDYWTRNCPIISRRISCTLSSGRISRTKKVIRKESC